MEEKSLRETTKEEKVRFGDFCDMKSDLSDCGITEDLRKELLKVLRNARIHDRGKQDMTSNLYEAEMGLFRKVKELRDAWIHDLFKKKAELLRNKLNHDRDKQDEAGKEEGAYSYVGLLRNVKVLRGAWNHDRDKQDMTSNLYEAEDDYSSEKYDYEQDMTSNLYKEEEEDVYSYVGLLRNVKVLRDGWIHDRDKQYMTFYEAAEEDKQYMTFYEAAAEEDQSSNGMYAEMLRNWNPDPALYEEEDEFSSEEYDYDYTESSQKYQDILKHHAASFLHEELLPTDKKRNPTLMGKQLLIKAIEEGQEGIWDSFENSQTVKEARFALVKHLIDFPRTIMNMATISHSLS